jgi:hypothetical protein
VCILSRHKLQQLLHHGANYSNSSRSFDPSSIESLPTGLHPSTMSNVLPWVLNEPINGLKDAYEALGTTASEFEKEQRHVFSLLNV